MELESLTKIGSAIGGALMALLLAAWKLSRIWTRLEDSAVETSKIAAETRDSLHGLAEDVSGRLGVIEVRLVGVDGENGACGDIRDIKVRLRDIEERTGPPDSIRARDPALPAETG